MESLTTADLARACRIFLDLAYAGAPDTIPANKLPFYEIDLKLPVTDFLLPSAVAVGVCQVLAQPSSGLRGYEFRLGSTSYPHIKLRVQLIDFHHRDIWVYSVDTHDHFEQTSEFPDSSEADRWRTMVDQNRQLKHEIEEALSREGYMTPKKLLQSDLPPSEPSR